MKTAAGGRGAPRPAGRRSGELDGHAAELVRPAAGPCGPRWPGGRACPAYVVFSDKTLRELAVTRPETMAELRAVSGVGAAKAERYGRAFLAGDPGLSIVTETERQQALSRPGQRLSAFD